MDGTRLKNIFEYGEAPRPLQEGAPIEMFRVLRNPPATAEQMALTNEELQPRRQAIIESILRIWNITGYSREMFQTYSSPIVLGEHEDAKFGEGWLVASVGWNEYDGKIERIDTLFWFRPDAHWHDDQHHVIERHEAAGSRADVLSGMIALENTLAWVHEALEDPRLNPRLAEHTGQLPLW